MGAAVAFAQVARAFSCWFLEGLRGASLTLAGDVFLFFEFFVCHIFAVALSAWRLWLSRDAPHFLFYELLRKTDGYTLPDCLCAFSFLESVRLGPFK